MAKIEMTAGRAASIQPQVGSRTHQVDITPPPGMRFIQTTSGLAFECAKGEEPKAIAWIEDLHSTLLTLLEGGKALDDVKPEGPPTREQMRQQQAETRVKDKAAAEAEKQRVDAEHKANVAKAISITPPAS